VPVSETTISVIITNYNYEQYVGTAIDSVIGQTRPADEIIVIDDGSTDGSRDRILSYGSRVRTMFQKNQGIKVISNTGYELSKGSIILYLDADDVLYPRALELVEQAFRPAVAKIQFDLDIIDQLGNLAGRRYCNFTEQMREECTARAFERTGTYLWPVTSGNAYSREFMRRVMPLTPPVSHDGVLNTIAPLYGRIVTIAQPLGQYRIHNRNISRIDQAGDINDIPDFATRINLRKLEFDLLREHAAALGAELPRIDFLDSEQVFVNYRLMARKLNREDGDDVHRSLWDLWLTGMSCLFHSPISFRARLKHIVWITSLAIAPAGLARRMISLRFNRTQRASPHASLDPR
jgi:glycosyltransferase involved in cell wall biosynthesis